MDWRDAVQGWVHGGVHSAESAFDRLVDRVRERTGRTDPVVIQPYRGFGPPDQVWVMGRVLEDEGIRPSSDRDSLWQNVVAMYRRFESDEVAGAEVELALGSTTRRVRSDEEGYFQAELPMSGEQRIEGGWVEVHARLLEGPTLYETVVRARVPGPDAEFGVISDIDDTILPSGATRLTTLARNTFLHNARTRLPFAGAAALYRALARGTTGDGPGTNPFFYVSSSPWNLYDFLDDFFELNGLPEGPILLRDLGVDAGKFIKEGHEHKLEKIERILGTFPALPFVLVGDSGQEDPELYTEAVRRHPGRIRAIYIRDVSEDPRDEEIERLAETAREGGVEFRRVADSLEAAVHAARTGLLPDSGVDSVRREMPPA